MIRGTGAPKFVIDPTGASPITILFDYIVVENELPSPDMIEFKSDYNGHREFLLLGKHLDFKCRMHLWKYELDPESGYTAKGKYLEMKNAEMQEGWFYRHREGEPYKSSIKLVFTVSGLTTDPVVGDTYSNNGITFEITAVDLTSHAGTITAKKINDVFLSPEDSGDLTKVTGDGDETIAYSEYTGNEVLFTLTDITEAYFDTVTFKDLLHITLKSKDYLGLQHSLYTPPSADDVFIDNPINTEDVL